MTRKRGLEWYTLDPPRVYLGETEQRVMCKSCLLEIPGGGSKLKKNVSLALEGSRRMSRATSTATRWAINYRPTSEINILRHNPLREGNFAAC